MKKLLVVISFIFSASALASSWEETFIGYGCGDSQASAKNEAISEAKAESAKLKRECDRDEGTYSDHYYQMGSCHEDGSDFFCRVSCSQMGKGLCEF